MKRHTFHHCHYSIQFAHSLAQKARFIGLFAVSGKIGGRVLIRVLLICLDFTAMFFRSAVCSSGRRKYKLQ